MFAKVVEKKQLLLIFTICFIIIAYGIDLTSFFNSLASTEPTLIFDTINELETTNTLGKYSSMICIGTEPNLLCHLKNICYYNQTDNYDDSKSFMYFLDPFLQNTSHNFLKSKIQISHHQNRYMQLNIINNQSLYDLNSKQILKLQGTTILHKVYRPKNLGHNLLDDWYPIWYTLTLFNKYNYFSNHLIFYGKTFFINEHINKIYNKMFTNSSTNYLVFPFFEEDYYLTKTTGFKNGNKWLWDQNELLRHNKELTPNIMFYNGYKMNTMNEMIDTKYICFEQILVGSHIFNQHWPNKQFNFNNFINEIFLNPNHPNMKYKQFIGNLIDNFHNTLSKNQRIILLNKLECPRRCFYNYTQLILIQQICKEKFNVTVDIYNSSIFGEEPLKNNLNEQIKFAMKYSILISTPGAISFLTTFMYKGTASIVLDFLDINKNVSTDIDPIYDLQLFKKRFRYKVTYNDIVYDKNKFNKIKNNNQKFDYVRDNVYFKININKMINMIKRSLSWVENFNNWQNTFIRDI